MSLSLKATSCAQYGVARGRILAAFSCSSSADAPCLFWQEKRVILLTIKSEQQCISLAQCGNMPKFLTYLPMLAFETEGCAYISSQGDFKLSRLIYCSPGTRVWFERPAVLHPCLTTVCGCPCRAAAGGRLVDACWDSGRGRQGAARLPQL